MGFESPGSTLSPQNLSERLANALRAYFFGGFLSFPTWDKNKYSIQKSVVKGKNLNVCLYKITRSDTGFKDLGLNPLIATSNGDLIGRQFFDFLKKMDEKIVKRMAKVQKNGGLPSKDSKYREYVRRLREFLKNEINRMLNRLINLYKPMKIIVEKLDFRSPGEDVNFWHL